MGCARPVESGFFPLDEELALLPGSLTPVQQECLVHLAGWMPFERAAQMLWKINGVAVSEATARRQTEAAGAAYEAVQAAQAQMPKKKQAAGAQTKPVAKQVMSSDGAYVPLVGGSWAEVKTLVLGEVPQAKQETGEQEVHTTALSYVSRMTDAETFADLAAVETRRRRLLCAKQVCAVMDGAEWLQGLIYLHRPDAIRILDFPHAAGYLSEIAELVRSAGTALPADWLAEQLHHLKHEGPTQMLKQIRSLREQHPHLEELDKKVSYLEKREAQMQYPTYQAAGWPISSGMVESANKQVVQVRLKGPGMHWAPSHVNPMLALRTAVCNDRWDEAWQEMTDSRRTVRIQVRFDRQQQRCAALLRLMQVQVLLLRLRTRTSTTPKKKPVPASPSPGLPSPRRPASDHPWRRRFLAKK